MSCLWSGSCKPLSAGRTKSRQHLGEDCGRDQHAMPLDVRPAG
jgi:hypothetical protein